MKQILTTRLSQQLTLTPQLQQAIRLLQLSAQDLSEEIQKALEANPLLELDGENADEADSNSAEFETISLENQTACVTEKQAEPTVEEQDYALEEAYPSDWSLTPSSTYSQSDNQDLPALEIRDTHSHSLQQNLLWQMHLTRFCPTDIAIATAIIDAIAEDGYLKTTLEDIQSSLANLGMTADLDEILAVLKRIQQFEPLGVGSRNPQEFLTLQLEQLPPDTTGRSIALKIIANNHLDLVAQRDIRQLKQLFNANDESIQKAIYLIKTLNPRPNYEICEEQSEYIIPDVLVYKRMGTWHVELNQKVAPMVHINRNYANLLREGRNEVQYQQLKDHLQEARWLVKSLASRNETLLKVARCIVARQQSFLEHGPTAMKPMILQNVALETELHESTISRITTQKYMQTPLGIFELKYFFSSHVQTHHGEECSSTAIRALIKKLILQEQPEKPLSDNQIAQTLESKQGIKIARRTITKYREALGISSSNERKRVNQAFEV